MKDRKQNTDAIEFLLRSLADDDHTAAPAMLKRENLRSVAARFAHFGVPPTVVDVMAAAEAHAKTYPDALYKSVAEQQAARRKEAEANKKAEPKPVALAPSVLAKMTPAQKLAYANGGAVPPAPVKTPPTTDKAYSPAAAHKTRQQTQQSLRDKLAEANKAFADAEAKKKLHAR